MPSYPLDPQRFQLREDCDGELVIFLNGILTLPGNQFAWTDRAERWMARHTRHEFDSIEYFHTPLLGPIFGDGRVYREALAVLGGYIGNAQVSRKPLRIHLVAHSHGCEIARRLILESGIRFETAHFFAAAIDADLQRNGLASALEKRKLQSLHIYSSTGDWVLKTLPPLSFGLYGQLGYAGPVNCGQTNRGPVHVTQRTDLGHSDWFRPDQFEESMKAVELWVDDLPF